MTRARTRVVLPIVPDELEDIEPRQMSDSEHQATFGWAWDDPAHVEVEA